MTIRIAPDCSWRRDLLVLFAAIALFFAIGLGARPYLVPSEARYIELPRQMIATGDWLTPRINGVPYFEKPPLFYWMQAAALSLFGTGEAAGRIVTALLATLACLVTYATGRMLYGRPSGLLAAGVLATSLLGYGLSRVAMLDMPVSLFITACIACFLAAQHTRSRKNTFYMLMYIAAALAVMTKGLIGIVVPGLVIGLWIAIGGRWKLLKEARLFTGLLLFLALVVPWHWLMAKEHPEFLQFYFIHEHFTRYLTDEHKRTAPWWFFIAVTLAGLLPWTGLLPTAFARQEGDTAKGDRLFMLLWVAMPFLFYSSSHSKLVPYIFPVFPPLAILLGRALAQFWEGQRDIRQLRRAAWFIVLAVGLGVAFWKLGPMLPGKLGHKLAMAQEVPVALIAPLLVALAGLGAALLARCKPPALIMVMGLFAVTTDLTLNYQGQSLDQSSAKPLAQMIAPSLQPQDMVVAYGSYWQDLPVYLNRNITVADWTGELGFGVEHYPQTQEWMISSGRFWERCAQAPAKVYVFAPRGIALPEHDSCRLRQLGEYGRTVLLEKQ